jgi:hypothetical protein
MREKDENDKVAKLLGACLHSWHFGTSFFVDFVEEAKKEEGQ